MPKTAAEIAKTALRDLNVVAAQRDLTQDQIDEGVDALKSFLNSLFGFEIGVQLRDWAVPARTTAEYLADWPLYPYSGTTKFPPDEAVPYPPQNVRLLLHQSNEFTLFFPPFPDDGARMLFVDMNESNANVTVDANGRKIEGKLQETRKPNNWDGRQYFYRADLADWIELTTLTETSESPLPELYDDLLVLGVVRRVARRYGKELTREQVGDYRRLIVRLQSQYTQRQPQPPANPQPFSDPLARQAGQGTIASFGGMDPFS